jgi:putative SOS response-associated peptidase YedK
VFGGVWSQWGTGTELRMTFSIITMPAIGALATVHERMPLLLDEPRWADWLSGSEPSKLLTPPPSEYRDGLELRPVSTAVGDVRKDGPELLRRVTVSDIDVSTVDSAPTLF